MADLKVLSYNIHKGFRAGGRTLVTDGIKTALHAINPDVIMLQEVVGQNDRHRKRFKNWSELPQHDFFREGGLDYACYGRNMIYPHGHHGNATLTRVPVEFQVNVDISVYKVEKRGFLYTRLQPVGAKFPLHAFCVHLGLLEGERLKQTEHLCRYVSEHVPKHEPLLIAGDFNDWRQRLTPIFDRRIGAKEAFIETYGYHVRSFPSWLPVSRLDRIYFRGMALKGCQSLTGRPWSLLSDHLPLVADFDVE